MCFEMPSASSLKNTINLGNSIIGVSILAMPYCFEKCGIILSSLLLLMSGMLTRMTCHLLLKAAITARRKNYEFLAFHTYGPTGKLVVEIGILGFLLGSCVAFFVVVGDLAPPLASDILLIEESPRLRTTVLLLLGTCVGLPLGLLRNLDSLTSFSAMSLVFYICLVFKIFVESFPVLWSGVWWEKVVLWRHEKLLSVLPIFAMALSCQPQLFEIFDTLNEPSLKRMNSVVNGAVQMCSLVYIMVGFFGYVAYCGEVIPGNILVKVGSSLVSEAVKLGFVATLVVSFPLCLFPCRSSLHSLLFKRGSKFHDPAYDYIPDSQFRALTVVLVGATLATAVLVPNIEVVLGLTGSTIGTLICIILPGMLFSRVITKSTNERLLAQILSWMGLFIMIGCTVTTLHNMSTSEPRTPAEVVPSGSKGVAVTSRAAVIVPQSSPGPPMPPVLEVKQPPESKAIPPVIVASPKPPQSVQNEKRLEPPEPQAPVEPPVARKPVATAAPREDRGLDPEALRKEDREIEDTGQRKGAAAQPHQKPSTSIRPAVDAEVKKQERLLESIAMEQRAQKKMLEELQRELKQELAKHKEESQGNNTAPKLEDKVPDKSPSKSQNKLHDKPDDKLHGKPQDTKSIKKPVKPPVQKELNKQPSPFPNNLDRADNGPAQAAHKSEHDKAEMDGQIQGGASVQGQLQGDLPGQLKKGSPVGLQRNMQGPKQNTVPVHESVLKLDSRSGQNTAQHEVRQFVQGDAARPVQRVVQDAPQAGVQLLVQRVNKMSMQLDKKTQETGFNQKQANETGPQDNPIRLVSIEAAKLIEMRKDPNSAAKELPQAQLSAEPVPAQQAHWLQDPKNSRSQQVAPRNEPLAVQMSKVVKREVSGDAADAVFAAPVAKDVVVLERKEEPSLVAQGATDASIHQSNGHGELLPPPSPEAEVPSLHAEIGQQAKHEIRK